MMLSLAMEEVEEGRRETPWDRLDCLIVETRCGDRRKPSIDLDFFGLGIGNVGRSGCALLPTPPTRDWSKRGTGPARESGPVVDCDMARTNWAHAEFFKGCPPRLCQPDAFLPLQPA